MNIILTGASSFTGFWFAKALAASGYQVTATLTEDKQHYSGLKKQRIELLNNTCSLVYACPFGSEAFLDLIASFNNIAALCHHGAVVGDYKSFHYQPIPALAQNAFNLAAVVQSLHQKSCNTIVITGSVFEPLEGIGDCNHAVSPYGLAKGLTSEVFRYYCHALQCNLGKFVIPNPFGPLEEARYINYLMQQWLAHKVATVQTPSYVRDNIHASLLARAYARFVTATIDHRGFLKHNPSGYVMSQGEFTQKIADELRNRIDRPCEFILNKQEHFPEPRIRVNNERVAHLFADWSESEAFDDLANFYLNQLTSNSLHIPR